MLRFYASTFRRTVGDLFTATDRYVTGVGVGSAALTFFSPELAQISWIAVPALSRWWALLPLGLLFLYGILKANYEEFQESERKNERLRASVTTDERRTALKDLLGDVHMRGENLDSSDEQEKQAWVSQTHTLIEAAFDKGTAQRFLSNQGYRLEGFSPIDNLRLIWNPLWISARLWRLEELILGIDRERLNVRPDFDLEAHARQIRGSPIGEVNLTVELQQTKEVLEKLKTDHEQVTAERDAFELESRKHKGELDGQIRGRCMELSDELFDFLKEAGEQDSGETMRRYRQRLRDKVVRVLQDVKKVGWWKPREDLRESLEYPKTPDELRSLAHYIRNIGLGTSFK